MLALMVIFDLLTSSNAAVMFSLVVPDGPISGPLGSSVVLPCTLSPSLDCKGYKISWYRPNNEENPVLLYEDLKVQENAGDPQYRGRASLVGDLQNGNVSLKLENLTLADRGEYVCYVNAYKWYEKASVFTTVTVVGSLPYLSLAEVGDQVNVTCASDGWSPKPTLIWRDKTGKELKNISEYYIKDSEGLVSVRSWLMFSPSDSEWISCSVGLSDQEMKEGRVLPLKTLQSGWKAAFIVLLVLFMLVISLLIFLMIKDHVWRKPSKAPKTDEETSLVGEASPSDHGVTQPLVFTERELNRADGETKTSGEFRPPPCAVYTDRKLNRADGETSGEIHPPTCAVCTERELNRADGETQTSGPETAVQTGSASGEKGPKAGGETQDPAPREEGSGSASGAADPGTDEQTQAGSAPHEKGSGTDEQTQAGSAPHEKGSGTDEQTQGSAPRANVPGSASGAADPAGSAPRANVPDPASGAADPAGSEPGAKVPGTAGSAPHNEGPGTGSASGAADPGTEEQTQGSAPRAKVPDSTSGDETPRTVGETQAGSASGAADPNTGKSISSSSSASPLPEISKTQADSNKDNTKRNKEKEKPDWNMMLERRVAIKPDLGVKTDLGVLFKERIRAGQYYWQVNGLPDPSLPDPSFRTCQSWYVGVISETVLKNKLQLSPQNSWVLHYNKENEFYVNDPSLTPVTVKDRFFRLGVFIDCEENTLSFYNHDKRSHLYTFYNVDCTQPLVPVVFPGLRPPYSLEISKLNCVECGELYQQYGTRNKQSWS